MAAILGTMTQAVEFPRSAYVANGVDPTFTLGFSCANGSEIACTVQTGEDDPVSRVYGAAFLTTGDLISGAGVVSFFPAYLPAQGDVVVFERQTPLEQPDAFGDTSEFRPSMVGRALDRVFRIFQEQQRDEGGGGGGGGGASTWAELGSRPANLDQMAALSGAADRLAYFTAPGVMTLTPLTATGRSLIAAASMAAVLALLTPLTTKGDIGVFGSAASRLPVGADGNVLVADSTATLGVKWAAPASGGGPPAYTDITSKPANLTAFVGLTGAANKVAYFTGSGAMAVADFTAFGRSLVAAVDATAANVLLGGTGTGSGPFKSLKSYGSTEDNSTDDKSAIDTFIADTTNARAWIEGIAKHTGLAKSVTKPGKGPGRIHFSASNDWVPAEFAWLVTRPSGGSGSDVNYYFSGDLSKVEASYYVLGQLTTGGNIRKGLSEPYYESVTTPRFEVLTNYSGWSGTTSRLAVGTAIGATSASLTSASGITNGDTLAFCNSIGLPAESKAVTLSGTTISWTGGLLNAYPATTAVTHGPRTMNAYRYTQINHLGGGDGYANLARAVQAYTPLPGQDHFFDTSTVGLFGGDIGFGSSGTYATAEEFSASDGGFDVAYIGHVHTYIRTNDTGARAVVWMGQFLKSEGTKPIDCFLQIAGQGRVGIDLSRGDYSTNGGTALQTAKGQRWMLNASVDTTPGARGWSDRFGALYAQVRGDMYIGSAVDGLSDIIELGFARSAGSDGRIRIRPYAVQINTALFTAAAATFGDSVCVPPTGLYIYGGGSGNYTYVTANALWFHSGNGLSYKIVGP